MRSLDDFMAQAMQPPKPRKKPRRLEDSLHLQVAKYLRAVIGMEGVASSCGVVWYSVETRARRSLREGAANKARGCISGCADLDIYHNSRAYKIELKAPKGRLQDSQEDLHAALTVAGVRVAVCRSIDDVACILAFWDIPTREAA